MADAATPPQRLEQRIAEPQRDQVLHRLLAEVVIDAIDLLFGEDRAHTAIDELGGGAVVAQRLLEHHARFRCHDPGGREVVAGEREQTRSGRQENDASGVLAALERRVQLSEVLRVGRIHLHVVHLRGEGAPASLRELVLGEMLAATRFDLREIIRLREVRARHRKHAGRRPHLSGNVTAIKRRHQLAHGEVARSAEQHHVERI